MTNEIRTRPMGSTYVTLSLEEAMKPLRSGLVKDFVIVFSVWFCIVFGDLLFRASGVREHKPQRAETTLASNGAPVLVVRRFSVAPELTWPISRTKIRSQLVSVLRSQEGNNFHVVAGRQAGTGRDYELRGEVEPAHPNDNLSTGPGQATIEYWVTDPSGKKVFLRDDTVPASDFHTASMRDLVQPLAAQVAMRLKESKFE